MKFNNRLTDEIYTSDTEKLGENVLQAMQNTIHQNGGIGTVTGYYDAGLPILSVSELLLHNLNHSYASLMERTKGSLKNLFYGENVSFLEPERFRQIQGAGEGQILTADGTPVFVRLYKEDTVDADGRLLWVLSVQVNWAYEDLALVNESIHSAPWNFECDETGRIVRASWSHAFRQILGYHDALDFPNQLDAWSNLLHPEDKDRVMTLLFETAADKTNTTKFSVEYRLRLKNGQYQWFRVSAEVIRRLDGTASRIAGIIWNIEEEKQSRMQAQRAEAFHRAFTSANLCEYYVDLEQNTFDTFKVEDSLMTAFEQSQTWDELVKFFVDNYVVEQDKQKVTEFYDRAYITEKLKGLETELCQECRIFLNGEKRWVRNVVMRGEIGDSNYAMIFLRDITESKAETARRMQMASANASMELLIQSMVRLLDRFVVCDLENDRYQFYNLQGERIYAPTGTYHGFVEQVVAKYKTLESLDALDALISPENIRRNLQGENDIYKFEYCALDENTYKIASFIPLEWDGTKLVKVLLASMDVSQEKKAEIESHKALKEAYRAAENASRAKTDFLSNMSHDIRTPMNAIVGLTAIAGANIENQDKVVECLGKITKSSRHLLGLINEVLDMARIESGKGELDEDYVKIRDIYQGIYKIFQAEAEKKCIHLKMEYDVKHEHVICDETKNKEIFLNLISNAVKYTASGGRVTIRITELDCDRKDYVRIQTQLIDTGIGMSEEFLPSLFEAFARERNTTAAKVAGTGLGMPIAKKLVEKMGGTITFESEKGVGTTFVIRVPFKIDPDADKREEQTDVSENSIKGLHILLAEDNELNMEIAEFVLQNEGADVTKAWNGQEAVELFRNSKPGEFNVILMDIMMPVVNGYEATKMIRSLDREDAKKIPIIAMTANAFTEDRIKAKAAGMDEHVAKPVDVELLIKVIHKLVK